MLVAYQQLKDVRIPTSIKSSHVHDVAYIEIDRLLRFENEFYNFFISVVNCEMNGCIPIWIDYIGIRSPLHKQFDQLGLVCQTSFMQGWSLHSSSCEVNVDSELEQSLGDNVISLSYSEVKEGPAVHVSNGG